MSRNTTLISKITSVSKDNYSYIEPEIMQRIEDN